MKDLEKNSTNVYGYLEQYVRLNLDKTILMFKVNVVVVEIRNSMIYTENWSSNTHQDIKILLNFVLLETRTET